MDDFKLDIEVEDNILYISNEDGSGAKYKVSDLEEVLDYIKFYINNYVKT